MAAQNVLVRNREGRLTIDPYAAVERSIGLVTELYGADGIDPRLFADRLRDMNDALVHSALKVIESRADSPEAIREIVAPDVERRVAEFAAKDDAHARSQPPEIIPPAPPSTADLSDSRAGRESEERSPEASIATTPRPRAAPTKERRAVPRRRRSDTAPFKLPGRIKSKEDAVRVDAIVCLEDGKAVQDLRKHLTEMGMTVPQYLRKWNLPASYPMKPPAALARHGVEFVFDPVHRKLIRV